MDRHARAGSDLFAGGPLGGFVEKQTLPAVEKKEAEIVVLAARCPNCTRALARNGPGEVGCPCGKNYIMTPQKAETQLV